MIHAQNPRSAGQMIRGGPYALTFILPMSAMKLRFFIAGILILARGFPFAVLKNERQAGF